MAKNTRESKPEPYSKAFFAAQGAKGGKIGGKISANNMTAEQRRERALRAVRARKWHAVGKKKKAVKKSGDVPRS